MYDPSAIVMHVGRRLRHGHPEITRLATRWTDLVERWCGPEFAGDIDWDKVDREVAAVGTDGTFAAVLAHEGWDADSQEQWAVACGMKPRMRSSFVEVCRDLVIKSRPLLRFHGGASSLPEALALTLADVRYGAEVGHVSQTRRSVNVHYETLGGSFIVDADAAIIALPVPSLRLVTFDPPLPPPLTAALRRVPYDPSVKAAIQVRGRRWESQDGVRGGISVTDGLMRNVHYPEPGESGERQVLVVGYTWGEDALRLGALDESRRAQLMVTELDRLHPGIASDVEVFRSVVWQHDPHFGGAFAHYAPGSESQLLAAISSPYGLVGFCGEHTSRQHGWVEGAVESGERAASWAAALLELAVPMTAGATAVPP